ncbi:hypothetical protein BYT27DRAFT_7263479 [Phlegmacium glaucopus]|nr:hypothetical protein BYT27DRAFT_7263479 [Phlegmacium glaucopus]
MAVIGRAKAERFTLATPSKYASPAKLSISSESDEDEKAMIRVPRDVHGKDQQKSQPLQHFETPRRNDDKQHRSVRDNATKSIPIHSLDKASVNSKDGVLDEDLEMKSRVPRTFGTILNWLNYVYRKLSENIRADLSDQDETSNVSALRMNIDPREREWRAMFTGNRFSKVS